MISPFMHFKDQIAIVANPEDENWELGSVQRLDRRRLYTNGGYVTLAKRVSAGAEVRTAVSAKAQLVLATVFGMFFLHAAIGSSSRMVLVIAVSSCFWILITVGGYLQHRWCVSRMRSGGIQLNSNTA
jgi:hypothetical protein